MTSVAEEHYQLSAEKIKFMFDGLVVHFGDFIGNSTRESITLKLECNMTVVDTTKDFLVHAWNKRQCC
ncbi:hypothetical protein FHG87_008411 [Trinorchestia longiramus]|nr:hypothetical protein FHG87_008411 [Trinorchestia longiramus]